VPEAGEIAVTVMVVAVVAGVTVKELVVSVVLLAASRIEIVPFVAPVGTMTAIVLAPAAPGVTVAGAAMFGVNVTVTLVPMFWQMIETGVPTGPVIGVMLVNEGVFVVTTGGVFVGGTMTVPEPTGVVPGLVVEPRPEPDVTGAVPVGFGFVLLVLVVAAVDIPVEDLLPPLLPLQPVMATATITADAALNCILMWIPLLEAERLRTREDADKETRAPSRADAMPVALGPRNHQRFRVIAPAMRHHRHQQLSGKLSAARSGGATGVSLEKGSGNDEGRHPQCGSRPSRREREADYGFAPWLIQFSIVVRSLDDWRYCFMAPLSFFTRLLLVALPACTSDMQSW
jgi:hypothetical protein